LFLFKIPRGAVTVYSPWISSAWVDAHVEKHQTRWLLPHRTRVNRIMTVDTESGRIIGCLRSIRGPVTGGMKIAPDGRRLAVADAGWLRWISASSGRCIALTTAGTFNSGYQNEFIAGFDGAAHDPWVYFAAADMSRGVSRLVRWRPRTGEQLVVVEEPAFAMTYKNGATAPLTRRYAILHRKDGIATASAPDFMQSYHEKDFSITIRAPESAGGAVERTFRVTDPFVETSPMIAHPGGDRISLLSGTFGLVDYETATGKRLQALRASGTEIPDRAMDLSPDGSRLVLPVHGQSVLVYDVPRKRWHARLNYPAPFIGPKVSISPDRRWVAAMPFKSTGAGPTGAPYLHELFLFDLGAP
jgi:hypothetical protein